MNDQVICISTLQLLIDLRKLRNVEIFFEPVTVSEAPGYFDIVVKPMDIGTMQAKVEDNSYTSRGGFMEDIDQVVSVSKSGLKILLLFLV